METKPVKQNQELAKMERSERIRLLKDKHLKLIDFTTARNKDYVLDKYSSYDLKIALKLKLIKLSEIEECYGQKSASVYLVPYILHIQQACGLDQLNELQANTIARALYSELFLINIAELTVFIDRVCMGKYGEFYGKLTPQMIGKACYLFKLDRMKVLNVIDRENRVLSETIKSKATNIIAQMPEEVTNKDGKVIKLEFISKLRSAAKVKKESNRTFDKKKVEIAKVQDAILRIDCEIDNPETTDERRKKLVEVREKLVEQIKNPK